MFSIQQGISLVSVFFQKEEKKAFYCQMLQFSWPKIFFQVFVQTVFPNLKQYIFFYIFFSWKLIPVILAKIWQTAWPSKVNAFRVFLLTFLMFLSFRARLESSLWCMEYWLYPIWVLPGLYFVSGTVVPFCLFCILISIAWSVAQQIVKQTRIHCQWYSGRK